MNATLTYDPDVRALSIQLSETDVLETVKLAEGVYLGVDRDGLPVAIEILNADPGAPATLAAPPGDARFPLRARDVNDAAPLTLATARTDAERAAVTADIMCLAREIRAGLPEPWRGADHGDLLYTMETAMHTFHLTVGPDGRVTIPDTQPGQAITVHVTPHGQAGPIPEAEREAIRGRVLRLAREIRAGLPDPWRGTDHGDLLYGEDGLPQ